MIETLYAIADTILILMIISLWLMMPFALIIAFTFKLGWRLSKKLIKKLNIE